MSTEEHIKLIRILEQIYKGNRFFVECSPMDIGSIPFVNTNFAVKEIKFPDFQDTPTENDSPSIAIGKDEKLSAEQILSKRFADFDEMDSKWSKVIMAMHEHTNQFKTK